MSDTMFMGQSLSAQDMRNNLITQAGYRDRFKVFGDKICGMSSEVIVCEEAKNILGNHFIQSLL